MDYKWINDLLTTQSIITVQTYWINPFDTRSYIDIINYYPNLRKPSLTPVSISLSLTRNLKVSVQKNKKKHPQFEIFYFDRQLESWYSLNGLNFSVCIILQIITSTLQVVAGLSPVIVDGTNIDYLHNYSIYIYTPSESIIKLTVSYSTASKIKRRLIFLTFVDNKWF